MLVGLPGSYPVLILIGRAVCPTLYLPCTKFSASPDAPYPVVAHAVDAIVFNFLATARVLRVAFKPASADTAIPTIWPGLGPATLQLKMGPVQAYKELRAPPTTVDPGGASSPLRYAPALSCTHGPCLGPFCVESGSCAILEFPKK